MNQVKTGLFVAKKNPVFVWLKYRIDTFRRDWVRDEPFDWRPTLAILISTIVLAPLVAQLPNLGFEWYHFDLGTYNVSYPPWMPAALSPLLVWEWRTGLALLTSLLLASTAIGAAREAKASGRASILGAALLAVCTAPVLMLMWLGNAATVTLFGVIALPFGIPLATVQPHLGSWALLARRKWTIWGIVFLIFTFVVWGWWPSRYFDLGFLLAHPIAMGWRNLGWPILVIGLILLVFSNADPLRLIAVGTFFAPYLMAVHLLLLTPAIGRTRGRARFILWLAAWLPLLVPMFATIWAKYLAMLFPLLVWWLLRPHKSDSV